MDRNLGIARCGLACCLCTQNSKCAGCNSEECPGISWCENRRCCEDKGLAHCYECAHECKKGLLKNVKPYAFTLFAKTYGEPFLLDCLEENEKNGIIYHRDGIKGDYDDFTDVQKLIDFIKSGRKKVGPS